ncbi:MAG TPA: YbaK/EbsC family protein [Chloroflexota bacterium]|nr:YbaK/EbsC family protein [Chloroflexota bacterium]
MKPSVQRVVAALAAAGVQVEIVEFAESTRTAEEAAAAVGTTVERIVKSLVFMAADEPLLALVSGGNRLDTVRLSAHLGRHVRRASADEAREATGFAIGGVPPLGHARPLPIFIDRDLMGYDLLHAAAGTPNAVFPITPAELQRVTGGTVLDLALRPQ